MKKYLVIRRCLKHDEFVAGYNVEQTALDHAELDKGFYVMNAFTEKMIYPPEEWDPQP